MKKSLIFWFAAVTCAALFLVGCESPTNGESGAPGSAGPATLPANATPELLAAYFASTDKVFLVDNLAAGTFVVPAGKTLAVVGDVELNNAPVIYAYDGTLDVALGTIDGKNTAVVIVAPAAEAAVKLKVSNASVPAYVASIPETITQITEDTLLGSLALGGEGTSVADLGIFAGTYTVYVKGTLAIDATTQLNTGNAKLVALGGATAKGTLIAGTNTKLGNLTASGALTLTGVSKADKLDTDIYTVTSSDTTVTLDSLVSGAGGKLILSGVVTSVDIGGGTGNIQFTNGTGPAFTAADSITAASITFDNGFTTPASQGTVTLSGAVSIPATKTIAFGHADGTVTLAAGATISTTEGTPALALTAAGNLKLKGVSTSTVVTVKAGGEVDVSGAGITFDGPVSFAGDLTLTAVPATFGGIASFADSKSLKTTTAASVVTLGPGAALAVVGYQSAWAHIIANYSDADVTLTPSSVETSLTFTKGATANARGITQKPTTSGNHSIATTGDVSLVAGSAYTVNSASDSVGTLTVTSETFSIQDGLLANDDGYDATANNVSAKLVLTADESNGALLTGAGSVIAGGTTIVPSANGLEVVESAASSPGTITIEADTITASTATASLTGVASGTPSITVAAGKTLTISTDTVVDLGIVGTLTLTGAASNGAQLAGAGVVKVGNASITGGWQAVGAGTTITLTATGGNAVSLTGTGTTPKLVGGTGGIISTGSNSTYSALTVQLLEIDLTAAGSIVIPHNSTASTVVLKGETATLGQITFNSAKATTTISSNTNSAKVYKADDGDTKAGTISGTGYVSKGSEDTNPNDAGSLTADTSTTNDATITGQTSTNDVTLDNTAKFKAN